MSTLPVHLALMAAVPGAVHPERCLWQRHQGATCRYCYDACPAGALQMIGRIVTLDAGRCIGCGACLAACPVECFEATEWSERSLVSTAARVGLPVLEVACKVHPAPQLGSEAAPVLQVNACLGAITPGLWFELGLKYTLRLRLEYCSACPMGKTSLYARRSLEVAAGWLETRGLADRLAIQEAPEDPAGALRRRVISAERPILNRRDFLFGFTRSAGPADQALACLPTESTGQPTENLPPHQPAWLRRLALVYSGRAGDLPEGGEAAGPDPCSRPERACWPSLVVAESCAACGVCARYCPSGALSTAVAGDSYQHRFSPGVCVACGLCAQVCRTGALARAYAPNPDPFTEQVVAERPVTPCRKCGSPALAAYNGLCYWCATEAPMRSLLDNARSHLLRRDGA